MEKPTLDFIKNEFLSLLETQMNYSKKTIESYNHDINKFYLYLKDNDVNSIDLIDKNRNIKYEKEIKDILWQSIYQK